jgi:hypothetical protein
MMNMAPTTGINPMFAAPALGVTGIACRAGMPGGSGLPQRGKARTPL